MSKSSPRNRFRKSIRTLSTAAQAAWYDIRLNRLGQVLPAKPATLNLLVNDICNSHCQMCLIWKRKQDKEISPDELSAILRDPLFSRLKYVGVSGGEPTLRKDLPELFRVLANKRPLLTGAGIITNAIQADAVIQRVTASAEICEKAGVPFSVMVSLDGVGPVHDRIRGRAGNFESAMKVIQYLQQHTLIPVVFGCTITKDNVWHVDELLDFAQAEGIHGRFRIAEYIQRLYNQDQTQFIRNFSPEERYHLALFFCRLEREFEKSPIYKRTYRNIRAMLIEDAPRTIRCPYQSNAVVLDCRGQLLYCSPKSPNLGSALEIPAERLYAENIKLRRQIIEQDCPQCIHDYHTRATFDELKQVADRWRWQRALSAPRSLHQRARTSSPARPADRLHHAFIVGWYGTETAGDKAILGQIIYRLKQRGTQRITLASLTPFLSRWTLQELGYPEVEVIPTYSAAYRATASHADLTIMGGGPLMDLAAIGPVLHAFVTAHNHHKQTWVAGCGIGPLKKPIYVAAVKKILRLASQIELRDSASVEWAAQHTERTDILHTDDPAVGFVQRWQRMLPDQPTKKPTLNCYLREWSEEYIGNLSPAEFQTRKLSFEQNLCKWISELSAQYHLQPRLVPMHHFTNGGDDRQFNRRIAQRYFAHINPIVEIRPLSVQEILQSMLEASFCITMRFHSTLFANTLGVSFAAVDYTSGGKVYNYLADHGKLNQLITISQIIEQNISPIVIKDENPAD